jgi:hypothetical protein
MTIPANLIVYSAISSSICSRSVFLGFLASKFALALRLVEDLGSSFFAGLAGFGASFFDFGTYVLALIEDSVLGVFY